ncbi:hypothetical protein Ccrd_001890 [Cynara cardunculus var. scolymus]|uniref:Uncharacterized protein n=1 Tax=Cynara cardunculus var. scolymus TaxID=59895 RepID=A0A118JWW4_CYNCS|nr:hypothetical protein Ccrd_001890 [Cynara cardunculus var. scolymus]
MIVTTTTTISFATTTPAVPTTTHHLVKNEEVEEDVKIPSDSPDRRKIKNTSPENQEKCPDLNLELRIGQPNYQHQNNTIPSSSYIQQQFQSVEYHHHQPLMTGGRNSGGGNICFACSLGIPNSKECSCTNGTSGNSTGYDFLGLKNGALDYRGLEMK